jgi:uncharacterized coiled-coil DUF342 family protein
MTTLVPPDTIDHVAYAPANERRAAALADIQQMHDDLMLSHDTIGQLKADLNRCHDRIDLLIEDRNRHRAEALLFRSKLIELATQMSSIGLMCIKAQELMTTVEELTTKTETPTAKVLDDLEHTLNGAAK